MNGYEELSTVYQKDSQGYQNRMTSSRAFLNGSLIGLFSFILANLFAAHLLSDCGLPAILGMDSCADDIARAGFPLIFLKKADSHFEAYSTYLIFS
jgi:hypothetical protein